jgi:Zn-dependent peptidase ImmA (M78 family)
VNPEVILRRLLTLGYISRKEYRAYRDNQFEKYKDSSATPGPIPVPYHTRLLNAAGEHFARTAFTAYYEQKITLVDLAASFSKCDPKHIPKLESSIFA